MSEAIRASGLTMAVGWIMGNNSRLLTNRGKQDGFGRKLGIDPYFTFHFPDARLAADDLHDNPHLITRNDRPAKLGLIYSQEVDECFAEVSVLFKQPEYGTCLGHRLDRQNAGHDGRAWKMTVEERLIDGDVLQRNDAFVGVDLNDTVHQEKRMPVRKNPHDLSNAQFHERISKFEIRNLFLRRLGWFRSRLAGFGIYAANDFGRDVRDILDVDDTIGLAGDVENDGVPGFLRINV